MAEATQPAQGTTALTCPKCAGSMRAYERSGITVDQCTECRGIFLDRGELERLIEAEADLGYGGDRGGGEHGGGEHGGGEHGGYGDDPRRRRRGGFLGDLLDFG